MDSIVLTKEQLEHMRKESKFMIEKINKKLEILEKRKKHYVELIYSVNNQLKDIGEKKNG